MNFYTKMVIYNSTFDKKYNVNQVFLNEISKIHLYFIKYLENSIIV